MNFCFSSHLFCGTLLQQPWQANTPADTADSSLPPLSLISARGRSQQASKICFGPQRHWPREPCSHLGGKHLRPPIATLSLDPSQRQAEGCDFTRGSGAQEGSVAPTPQEFSGKQGVDNSSANDLSTACGGFWDLPSGASPLSVRLSCTGSSISEMCGDDLWAFIRTVSNHSSCHPRA